MSLPKGWIDCADDCCGGICKVDEPTKLCRRCREAEIARGLRPEAIKDELDNYSSFNKGEQE